MSCPWQPEKTRTHAMRMQHVVLLLVGLTLCLGQNGLPDSLGKAETRDDLMQRTQDWMRDRVDELDGVIETESAKIAETIMRGQAASRDLDTRIRDIKAIEERKRILQRDVTTSMTGLEDANAELTRKVQRQREDVERDAVGVLERQSTDRCSRVCGFDVSTDTDVVPAPRHLTPQVMAACQACLQDAIARSKHQQLRSADTLHQTVLDVVAMASTVKEATKEPRVGDE